MRAFFAAEGAQNIMTLLTSAAGNLAIGNYLNVVGYSETGLGMLGQLSSANPPPSPEVALQARAMVADLNFMRGFAQCNLRKYAEAEKSYSDGIDADPDFTLLYLLRAETRLKQQNQDGAGEDLAAVQQSRLGSVFAPDLAAAQAGKLSCETLLEP